MTTNLFQRAARRPRRWVVAVGGVLIWLLALAARLPVPTPLEVVATPIARWPMFAARAEDQEDPASALEPKPVALSAQPPTIHEQDAMPPEGARPKGDSDVERAVEPRDHPEPSRPAVELTRVVPFGPEDDTAADHAPVTPDDAPEDLAEPEPAPVSPAERLLNVVAAGQQLIDSGAQLPTIGAQYSMETLEEYVLRGWFHILVLVDAGDSPLPQVYALSPDRSDPLRRGEFVLADSTFVATRISQLALPVELPGILRLFELQVGVGGRASVRVRARADVARYIRGKQLGALEELGFSPAAIQRGPAYTDGTLLVGNGRPVYRIRMVRVGVEAREWVDPEGPS